MNTKSLTVFIFAVLSSALPALPARAESVAKQFKSCVDTCYIEQMACQFNNDLETCDTLATKCSRQCDNRFPAVSACLGNCDGEWTFCRQDGYSLQSVCTQEKLECSNRCQVPNTVSQNER